MDNVFRRQLVRTRVSTSVPSTTEHSFPGVAVLLAIAACMLLSSALAQDTDADRFYERWLRAFGVQSVDDIPRFAGPVAEVARTPKLTGKSANAVSGASTRVACSPARNLRSTPATGRSRT